MKTQNQRLDRLESSVARVELAIAEITRWIKADWHPRPETSAAGDILIAERTREFEEALANAE
jgi:hypothetical protein